jgi:serine-type D-Ala-D-Ala carboxypeptidase/endopeptidase (penicillin-binding protein 4)
MLLAAAAAIALLQLPLRESAATAQAAQAAVTAPQAPPAAPAAADGVPAPGGEVSPEPAAALPVAPAVLELRRDLDQVVRTGLPRASPHGILVVSLDRGDTLFSSNPDLSLAPASNMKLFSTAAALYYLGPSFRYSTFALADGEIRDGILDGDVVLYGTGDPAISSRLLTGALPPLRALADSLLARGVREIRGDVVGDGSYFDDVWIGEGWREEYRLASYSAPIGALSLAENIVSVRIVPGAAVGQPAEVRTVPSTIGFQVQNHVRTVASGASSVRITYHPDGLLLQGQITRGHAGIARTVSVVDPANFAAAAFRNVLEQAGIVVHGGVRTVRDVSGSPVGRGLRGGNGGDGRNGPPPRVMGIHLSPAMDELTTVTNHVSQNLFAEALFKTVGRVALGEGTFPGGSRAVRYFLECENPLDTTHLQLIDGSGLSPLNRVTARATIHLLDLMTRTDVWETFYNSLPEAAAPTGGLHSLRNRMGGTPAARNLRAKTGTISNVSSLSGYVRAANGELIAFAIYSNDVPTTAFAKRMEDAIGIRLARFTRPAEPAAVPDAENGPPADPSPEPEAAEPLPASDEPAPGATATPPAPAEPPAAAAPRVHTVAQGETLGAIARRYGTTVAELERLNPGLQPRRLQIGQRLTVPR